MLPLLFLPLIPVVAAQGTGLPPCQYTTLRNNADLLLESLPSTLDPSFPRPTLYTINNVPSNLTETLLPFPITPTTDITLLDQSSCAIHLTVLSATHTLSVQAWFRGSDEEGVPLSTDRLDVVVVKGDATKWAKEWGIVGAQDRPGREELRKLAGRGGCVDLAQGKEGECGAVEGRWVVDETVGGVGVLGEGRAWVFRVWKEERWGWVVEGGL